MKIFLSILVTLILVVPVALAQEDGEGPPDPMDLSRYRGLISQESLPTVSGVAEAEQRAMAAVESGDCEAAIDLLDEWITKSNWLSNLVAQGLEPFYDAPRSDREGFSMSRISQLADLEQMANRYKADRNIAMVMKAECLAQNGTHGESAATFAAALDLIDIDNWALWVRATNGLYALIGVEPLED